MSAGNPFMQRARQLGACHTCCYERHATEVEREHPECYRLILDAMDERYGHLPIDRLRIVMFMDGTR